jgi:hypothetical protein
MSRQNEIAFLNSLLLDDELDDEEETRSQHKACPEPAILWSLTQKELAGSAMVEELHEHVANCPSCADLSRRLHAFHHSMQEETATKQEENWPEAETRLQRWMREYLKSQPKADTGRKMQWHFPRLSWALPLAAGCAAVGVLVAVLANHHGAIQQTGERDSLASLHGRNEPAEPPTPGVSGDKSVLMGDSKVTPAEGTAGDEPPTITFAAGEHMKLWMTAVERQADGSYTLEGRLMPVVPSEDGFESAEVTGIFIQNERDGELSLSITELAVRNKRYRVPAATDGDQIAAVFLQDSKEALQTGHAQEIQIVRGRTLEKLEP